MFVAFMILVLKNEVFEVRITNFEVRIYKKFFEPQYSIEATQNPQISTLDS